jgi:hypothetical protein
MAVRRKAYFLASVALGSLLGLCTSGCLVYQAGGAKVYNATASTDLGRSYVEEYHLKYVCRNTWGLFFSDVWRGDCLFATDVEEKGDQIQWRQVDSDLAQRLELKPAFTFWNTFGCWIAIPLGLGLCFIVIKLQVDSK